MRLPLAVLGLLLLTGCTAAHPARHAGTAPQPGSVIPSASSPSAETPVPESSPTAVTPVRQASTPAPTRPAPTTTPPRPSSSAPVPHTRQVVLRPVTETGRLAPGYTLTTEPPDDRLSCGGSAPPAEPSAVAVDDGIAFCTPSAAYAVACWPGPMPNTARCFQDPWQHKVDQVGTEGPLTPVRAVRVPSPLGLELSDGARCSIRDGGAWGQPVGHPELFGSYGCGNGEDVWATRDSDGINRTAALWTVLVGADAGRGPLHTVTVRRVYFVGTSRA